MSHSHTKKSITRATMARVLHGFCIAIACQIPASTWAAQADYAQTPFALQNVGTPLVMLTASRDHQLFFEAYSDYEDINDDGVLDTTYKDSIDYNGYFDKRRCYVYDSSNKYLYPVRKVLSSTGHKCNISTSSPKAWSGNFLNWASMARIDIVRKMLYGGTRKTDTAGTGSTLSETVLERAYLPSDGHSFAKYYNGTDLSELTPFSVTSGSNTNTSGITLCNTSVGDVTAKSENSNAEPRIRVAQGNYSLWASGEKVQCLFWDASTNNDEVQDSRISTQPSYDKAFYGNNAWINSTIYTNLGYKYNIKSPGSTSSNNQKLADMVARVKTCVPLGSSTAVDYYEDFCKVYSPLNVKPVGLLQQFGENDSVKFGLMTGSYTSNKQGGVLRKHIGNIDDEINLANGTFKSITSAGSIIKTFDALRITGWIKRADNTENRWYGYLKSGECGSDWSDKGEFFANGECTASGNPFAEILAESYRYFSGATSPTSEYAANDQNKFSNSSIKTAMTSQSWSNNPLKPQADSPYACSSFNVLAFNASTTSYDGDNLGNVVLGGNTVDVNAQTNAVGTGEGIGKKSGSAIDPSGPKYFIGYNNPTATDAASGVCSLKNIGDLSNVSGTCPDSPDLKGTYKMAGLAYYANTNDVNNGTGFDGKQTVRTFGVTLVPSLPKIEVPSLKDNSKKVTIIPVCRSTKGPAPNTNKSYNGGCSMVDFKVIKHNINPSGDTNKLYGEYLVNWEYDAHLTDFDQDVMGIIKYTLTKNSGAGNDTISVTTRIIGDNTSRDVGFGYVISGVTNEGFYSPSALNGYSNCPSFGGSQSNCKGLDVDATQNFTLANTTAATLKQPLFYAAKWGGFIDENGNKKPDQGEWNDYTSGSWSSEPKTYADIVDPDKLTTSMAALLSEISAGSRTSTGNAITTTGADGAGIVLQSYFEPKILTAGKLVRWGGGLNTFFKDEFGNLREDNDGDGTLDNDDKAFVITTTNNVTTFERFSVNSSTGALTSDAKNLALSQLKPLWSARDRLAEETTLTSQRTYSNTTGRYIFTGKTLAQSTNGYKISNSIDFISSTFTASTGGDDDDGGSTTGLPASLLDIPSTPIPAGLTPEKLVNFIRGDTTISGARNRTVKFNSTDTQERNWLLGDIVNSKPLLVRGASERYDTVYNDSSYRNFRNAVKNRRHVIYVGANDGLLHAFNAGFYNVNTRAYSTLANSQSTTSGRKLGTELWAYAPYSLLPHLKWLADPNYSHVYYVDGEVKSFDVKLFNDDTAHPGGWGTILVAAQRFGGGTYAVDHDNNSSTPAVSLRSSIAIFDISDPESAPKLLGEFSDSRLGYTTTNFDIQRSGGVWNLVFGSGPTDYNFTSTQTAQVFRLPLTLNTSKDSIAATELTAVSTGETQSYVGGINVEDWDRNGTDEVAYFTTVGASKGSLRRLVGSTTNRVINVTDREFQQKPTTLLGNNGEAWIFAGSGKFVTGNDKTASSNAHRFYAIKESFTTAGGVDNTEIANSNLVDVTGVKAFSNNTTKKGSGSSQARSQIVAEIKGKNGWKLDFGSNERFGQIPQVSNGKNLVFSTFAPGSGCAKGAAYLYEREYFSGLPPLASKQFVDPNATVKEFVEKTKIGDSPSVINVTSQDKATAVGEDLTIKEMQLSNETPTTGRQAWREVIK
jgi:type IV pilus assembly protein PilY1